MSLSESVNFVNDNLSSSCSVTGTAFYIVVLVILYTFLQSITYYRHCQYLRTLDDKALCSLTLSK